MAEVTLSPGTMADDAAVGTVAWSNSDNAKASDNAYATAGLNATNLSHYLKATNFGFSIPAGATINGIKVEVEVKHSSAQNETGRVVLVKGGVFSGNQILGSAYITTTEKYISYGSSTELGGNTFTASDINDATFGAGFIVSDDWYNNSNPNTVSVDHIRITVYYTEVTTSTSITTTSSSTSTSLTTTSSSTSTSLTTTSTSVTQSFTTSTTTTSTSLTTTSTTISTSTSRTTTSSSTSSSTSITTTSTSQTTSTSLTTTSTSSSTSLTTTSTSQTTSTSITSTSTTSTSTTITFPFHYELDFK